MICGPGIDGLLENEVGQQPRESIGSGLTEVTDISEIYRIGPKGMCRVKQRDVEFGGQLAGDGIVPFDTFQDLILRSPALNGLGIVALGVIVGYLAFQESLQTVVGRNAAGKGDQERGCPPPRAR